MAKAVRYVAKSIAMENVFAAAKVDDLKDILGPLRIPRFVHENNATAE